MTLVIDADGGVRGRGHDHRVPLPASLVMP
jgi:hypothetical protein